MKVVYMDPNNPLPDRQYYGRVQLVEVRNQNGNGLPFYSQLHIKNTQVICAQGPNTVDLKYKQDFLSLFTAALNLCSMALAPDFSTSKLGILSTLALSTPSGASGVIESVINGR